MHAYKDSTKNLGHIEIGAQWIHGQVGNVAYKVAHDHGIVDLSSSADEDEMGKK